MAGRRRGDAGHEHRDPAEHEGAERDGAEYVLNGSKRFITNAPRAGAFTLMARTGGPGAAGISAFIVPAGLPGLSLVTESDVVVAGTESRWISVRLHLPYDAAQPGSHPIQFHISSYEEGKEMVGELHEKSVFLVPR